MEQMIFFLALIAGFLFGALIVWLIQRNDVRQAFARARTEFNAEIAGLTERVKSRENKVAELRAELDERERELATLSEEAAGLRTINADLSWKMESAAAAPIFAAAVAPSPQPDWNELLGPLQHSMSEIHHRLDNLRPTEPVSPIPIPLPNWNELLGPLHASMEEIHECIESMRPAESTTPAPVPVPQTDWQELLRPLQSSLESVDSRLQEIGKTNTVPEHEFERLNEELRSVREVGSTVFQQLQVFGERFAGVGRNLELAIESHNFAAVSLESRVMAAARNFQDSHKPTEDLAELAEALGQSQRIIVNEASPLLVEIPHANGNL